MKINSATAGNSPLAMVPKKRDLFPLLLLVLCFLIFGLLIPFLGFYWDDFPYLFFGNIDGPIGVFKAISMDRPVLGLFYILPITLLKTSSILWQLFAILCRWLFITSVYYFLGELWPKRKSSNKLIILLFLIYPGFSQQWISVIYSHIFLVFALYFYSLKLFTATIRKPPKQVFIPMILSIAISLVCMSAVEYVVGLETIKPLIIYKFLYEENKGIEGAKGKVLHQTLRLWLPHLFSTVLFITYRLFLANSVLYTQQIISEKSNTLSSMLLKISLTQFKNVYTSVVSAWMLIFEPLYSIDFSSKISLIYLSLFFLFFLFAFLFTKRILAEMKTSLDLKWIKESVFGSFISLLAAGLPFAAANLIPGVFFPGDRFLLPFMLGSAVLLFILLSILQKKKILFSLFFSIIFSLSASYQFILADSYRKDWTLFQDFVQQFSLRVPSIKPDTIFITNEMPMRYYSDNSLTAPINLLYASEKPHENISYLISFTDIRLGNSLKSLKPGQTIYHPYRTKSFSGSTDQMVYFYFEPPGCFHIADPEIDPFNPLISESIRFNVNASNLDQIDFSKKINSVFFTKSQTNKNWCYYYQKASLAAQKREWDEVVNLSQKAFNLDDYPNDASERIPFIEAFAMTGNMDDAVKQSRLVHDISSLYDPMLCALWTRIEGNTSEEQNQSLLIQNIKAEFLCQNKYYQ